MNGIKQLFPGRILQVARPLFPLCGNILITFESHGSE